MEEIIEIELDLDPEEEHIDNSDSDSDSVASLHIENHESDIENDAQYPAIDLENFSDDIENEIDYEEGWRWLLESDEGNQYNLPFIQSTERLNMASTQYKPEEFFEALFDNSFWTLLVDNTNKYAKKKKTALGNDVCQQLENPLYKKFSRLNAWRDVIESEMQVFVAHMIVMGIVKKPDLEKYWCRNQLTRTPFFGQKLSRDRFCNILWNFHVADDTENPKYGEAGHDALAKIRPFIEMCNDNFKFVYKPDSHLSLDEGCCPWKGRLRFRCYNPSKPSKFHIKLYQISESDSGYVIAFNIYTGKGSCHREDVCIDKTCTVTTKTVMTLARQAGVLDKGHKIFFDNYYTSPELMEELLYRHTLACGTVRSNRKGLPIALSKAKLKPGQCVFRRKFLDYNNPGPLLALRWCDKRPVYMLSTMHSAVQVWTGKKEHRTGNPIFKPAIIVDYTKKMGGVDMSDQLMNYYHFLRKSVKWWRKLWIHLLNMLVMNSFILNRKYGCQKMSHIQYREYIAEYLLHKATLPYIARPLDQDNETRYSLPCHRLHGKHYLEHIPTKPQCHRSVPLACKVCFVGKKMAQDKNIVPKRKMTSYRCEKCKIPMCIIPCFKIYHEEENYIAKVHAS